MKYIINSFVLITPTLIRILMIYCVHKAIFSAKMKYIFNFKSYNIFIGELGKLLYHYYFHIFIPRAIIMKVGTQIYV